MYSDNAKKEYMRMFFDDQPPEFCEHVINGLKLKDENQTLLKHRYVDGKTDKMIARYYELSPDRINKKINQALINAYDALKYWQYNAYKSTK